MKNIWCLFSLLFLLAGCAGNGSNISVKQIEARIYDDIAQSVNKHCLDQKNRRPGVGTELFSEAARDVAQRTVQYGNESIGEQFHSLAVICAGYQPVVSQLNEFYFESGWSPGTCPSENSDMGCPPKGWEFTKGNWLYQYEQRHCELNPDKCTLDAVELRGRR